MTHSAVASTELAATLTRTQAAQTRWDAIVVGAGIAGSISALGLSRLGRKVLIIERHSFPRQKVCGACLNQNAIDGFSDAGVWPSIESLGGHKLEQFCLRSGNSRATLTLPGGYAVSRSAMDQSLAEAAIAAGADYLSDTAVTICDSTPSSPTRSVIDNHGNRYDALMVVAANGLGSQSLSDHPNGKVVVQPGSRIGLGAQWTPREETANSAMHLSGGVIYMAVGANGYVGLVVTEGGRINLAAAVDRSAVQSAGPARVCDDLLRQCGWDLRSDLTSARFLGTRTLTRRRAIAGGHRLFFVGDSSGYVEPFTGEGMGWAVRASMAVVPWVDEAIEQWRTDYPLGWTEDLKQLLGRQRRRCRLLSKALRHPTLVRHAVKTLSRFPSLGRFAVEKFQRERFHTLPDHGARRCRAWSHRDAA